MSALGGRCEINTTNCKGLNQLLCAHHPNCEVIVAIGKVWFLATTLRQACFIQNTKLIPRNRMCWILNCNWPCWVEFSTRCWQIPLPEKFKPVSARIWKIGVLSGSLVFCPTSGYTYPLSLMLCIHIGSLHLKLHVCFKLHFWNQHGQFQL